MLRLHLEACTPQPSTVGWLLIRNDGTGDATIGHYAVSLAGADWRTLATSRVTSYPRALGPWVLAQLALQALSSAQPSLDALWHGTPAPALTPEDLAWAQDTARRLGLLADAADTPDRPLEEPLHG